MDLQTEGPGFSFRHETSRTVSTPHGHETVRLPRPSAIRG
jgi:hypothetical protein